MPKKVPPTSDPDAYKPVYVDLGEVFLLMHSIALANGHSDPKKWANSVTFNFSEARKEARKIPNENTLQQETPAV